MSRASAAASQAPGDVHLEVASAQGPVERPATGFASRLAARLAALLVEPARPTGPARPEMRLVPAVAGRVPPAPARPPLTLAAVAGAECAGVGALPRSVALICPPVDALGLGAALGLALAAGARPPTATVSLWGVHGPAEPGPATGAARRAAARAREAGLEAVARGRLAFVSMPDDPRAVVDAAAAIEALAAADGAGGRAGVVTVVAGARPQALDAILASHERAVVAADRAAPAQLAELATADLARIARATGVLSVDCSPLAMLCARAGVLLSPALRAAVLHALREPV